MFWAQNTIPGMVHGAHAAVSSVGRQRMSAHGDQLYAAPGDSCKEALHWTLLGCVSGLCDGDCSAAVENVRSAYLGGGGSAFDHVYADGVHMSCWLSFALRAFWCGMLRAWCCDGVILPDNFGP